MNAGRELDTAGDRPAAGKAGVSASLRQQVGVFDGGRGTGSDGGAGGCWWLTDNIRR